MTWVVWRLHRTESLISAGVVTLFVVFLVVTGVLMAHTYQQSGLAACLARTGDSNACGPLGPAFLNLYGPFLVVPVAIAFLPILLGALVGAPLVARDLEQRTYLLAWMQSVTRQRWLAMTEGVVLASGLLAAVGLMALLFWWYHPFILLIGQFSPPSFDFSGPVLPAATILALALGIAAGALTHRTVPAILLTLVLVLAVRVPVEVFLRPNFEPQITVTWPIGKGNTPPVKVGVQDWQTGQGYIDAHGNKTNQIQCGRIAIMTPTNCLKAGGYRWNYVSYQPANRFWTFQWIETGIYLAVSALAVALTFLLIVRRTP
jgi:hypothetical protein